MRIGLIVAVCLALSTTSCRLQPESPTEVSAVAGVRQATVRWTAPPQASSPFTITYTVVASPGGATASTTALEATVTGLENGTTYTFTVVAENRFGASPPSAPSAPVTTPDVPGAPTGVAAQPGPEEATVGWDAPASDGGSAVTSYTVTASPGGLTAAALAPPAVVTGLTSGTTYTFTVTATNAVGTGPASAPSAPIVPTAPQAFDTADVPVLQAASALDPSWKQGPFMHVFVRAYRDSNGDGEGDLGGVIEKLDYLRDLGIRGILLLPVFDNDDRDHGYLTTNFRRVAPDYGSLADLDRLLAEAHARGIGVVLDGVFQYSGSAHPGFVSASGSLESPWRDWYLWSEANPGWGAWWESPTGWYFGQFGERNPVFNWKNPAVRAYHQNTLRYWLNRGVDGFRVDAVQGLVLSWWPYDDPNPLTAYDAARELRQVMDQYQNRLLLCEAPFDPALPWRYPFDPSVFDLGLPNFAGSDVCGGGFLFSMIRYDDGSFVPSQAAVLAAAQGPDAGAAIGRLAYDPMQVPIGSMGTLLGNHDRFSGKRIWDQLDGDESAYRLAAATLLLMPGAPFVYYGEEVGMSETVLPTANPDSDHHQRGVMSWTADPATAGFSAAPALDGPRALSDPDDKYLKPVPNAATHNVAVEQANPDSLHAWYRQLIALRHAHPALARGLYQPLLVDGGAWAFSRSTGDEEIVVAINYEWTEHLLTFAAVPGTYEVLVSQGAPTDLLTVGDDGFATVALPPQSMIAYRQARDVPPLGELYVYGSFNDWTAVPDARLAYVGGNRYQGTLSLPAGQSWFKLSTEGWDWRVDVGISGGGEVRLGEPRALEQVFWRNYGRGSDVSFVAPAEGVYELTLAVDDLYRPVLTLQRR